MATSGSTGGARGGGLEGIVVADTMLSDVDGENGRLVVVGDEIEALTGTVSFESLCARLWQGDAPAPLAENDVRAGIAEGRLLGWKALPLLGDALQHEDGMDALRAATAHLAIDDAPLVVGAIGTFAAAWGRTRSGHAPIAPDPSRGHAADYAHMLGLADDAARSAALDAYFVTVADHGMNASTFTARVITSTGSDMVSAMVGAIGALKGPLHGGAPGPVLDMLDAIGDPSRATAWLEAELAAGRRIMGMGHRIYRVRDPRAAVLEREVAKLDTSGAHTLRLALARAVEHAAEVVLRARHPDRPLRANVEFYTAVLLDTIGLPVPQFSPTFAVGRAAGWCAHIQEQRRTGRLIRPASRYVGRAA